MRERRRVVVKGVVQGVGFRPFIYRIAHGHGLAGSVRNRGDAGVEIFIEGDGNAIAGFLQDLADKHPPLSEIRAVETEAAAPTGERGFSIVPSAVGGDGAGSLPPDCALCEACLADIRADTRYRDYWATSCTDCGPRFTVIESLPYDRTRTSMHPFPMCEACTREYTDPLDRRYHAQTIACPKCGPQLTFDGDTEDPLGRLAAALASGRIVAIKGIGGTHLACDATDAQVVDRLRRRLGRPSQPFALMASERVLDRIAVVEAEEWAELQCYRRPIVVLRSRAGSLPEAVAPGLHTVGVMLPYTALHHLLFDRLDVPLVMTSANLPGQPMLIDDEAIRERLVGIVDHVLLHDRKIVARCDDSVVRRSGGMLRLLRRSRGFVPQPIPIDLGTAPILALGPETDLTFALYADGATTLSQHIGSVDNLESYGFFQEAIDHLVELARTPTPRIVACDLHPTFLSTRHAEMLAERYDARLVRVQHHEAHVASVMAEHRLSSCVGIVLDGYGYGRDGAAWGGEVFVGSPGRLRRAGTLEPVPLPGGDLATRQPMRMVASLLHSADASPQTIARRLQASGLPEEEIHVVLGQLQVAQNTPLTSSAGRFLDAVSALLGVCRKRTYEGEPAMRLEAAAAAGSPQRLPMNWNRDGRLRILQTPKLFASLVEMADTSRLEDVAATAQTSLAAGVAAMATEIAAEEGESAVVFSGGVAYNDAISREIRAHVERHDLRFHANERVPSGDGGVSFGQLVVASWVQGS